MKRNVSGQILPKTPILLEDQGLQIVEEEVPIQPKIDKDSMEIPQGMEAMVLMQVPTTKGMDKHLWVICSVLLNASTRFRMDLQQIANTSVLLLDPRIEGLKPVIIVCVSDVSKLEKVTTTGEVALLLSVQYAWARIMLWYVWYRRANKKTFPLNRAPKMMMTIMMI